MSIYFIDGIERYGTSGDCKAALVNSWGNVASTPGTATVQTGRYGGKGFSVGYDSGTSYPGVMTLDLSKVASGAPFSTLVLGVAMRDTGNFSSNSQAFIRFLDASGNVHVQITCADGMMGGATHALEQLQIYRGGTSIVAATATGTSTGTFNYYEFKVTIHDSTGVVQVKVDNTQIINFSGDTRNGGTASIQYIQFTSGNGESESGFWPSSSSYGSDVIYFDDIYIASDFVTNAYTSTIKRLAPTSDGTTTDWTPSTGSTDYTLVDEIPPNGATDYVSTSATSTLDLYGMANLGTGANDITGTIHCVQLNSVAKNTGTSSNLTHKMRVGSTNYSGGTFTPTVDFLTYHDVRETSPATSTNWTVSEVNAIESGVSS